MSKSYLKGSLLATTVIAGFAAAVPAYAQDATNVPPPPAGTTAPGGETTPGDTQAGTTANTGPGASGTSQSVAIERSPVAGVQAARRYDGARRGGCGARCGGTATATVRSARTSWRTLSVPHG